MAQQYKNHRHHHTHQFLLIKFLPALLVLPVWATIALRENILSNSFRQFYPLSVAMIFGSLIAGSTPLGGGVVAFPVSVLSIGFNPAQGRDFSLMIQSCGMTAASFLVLLTRPYIFRKHGVLLAKTCFFNVIGLICGEFVVIPPFIIMCIYTTSVACFAVILAYVERYLMTTGRELPQFQTDQLQQTTRSESETSSNIASDENEDDIRQQQYNSYVQKIDLQLIPIAVFSFVGGVLSSKIGTGADMTWYAYGSLIYNSNKQRNNICDNDLTAISIIVMTVTSIFGTVLRVTSTGENAVTTDVYQAIIACACIVVLGAPLGSLFLSKNNQRRLKLLFYILSALQLAIFGIIKIRSNIVAWCAVGGSLCLVAIGIAISNRVLREMAKTELK